MHRTNQYPARHRRRRKVLSAVLVALAIALPGSALLVFGAPQARAQSAAKSVQGKVYDKGSTPLPGAIVYLQDQKTNVIKTFIATGDGGYQFGQLPTDTDYKIWAEFKGEKSKPKLISSFDSKLKVTQDFHIG